MGPLTLKGTHHLSKTFQNFKRSAAEGLRFAKIAIRTLKKRNEARFKLFWDTVNEKKKGIVEDASIW